MAEPLLQAQIDIGAPVAKVWGLVSDFERMPQWRTQCRMMTTLGALRQVTRTVNLNRRDFMFWPTTCPVTEVSPEKKLAFWVNADTTVWSYELESTANGTRLVERRHGDNGTAEDERGH